MTDSGSILEMFKQISGELDCRNDKNERIVKISRDITIESKRTISLLQRSQLQNAEERKKSIERAEISLAKIRRQHFFRLAREMEFESPYYFNRSYTFGLQEYIEAASFLYYLIHGSLISHTTIQESLVFEDVVKKSNADRRNDTDEDLTQNPHGIIDDSRDDESTSTKNDDANPNKKKLLRVFVGQHDYILGLMDLTGELMRATINANPVDSYGFILSTTKFLQLVYQGCVALFGYRRKELSKKISVLLSSVLKLEYFAYTLKIRELDKFGGSSVEKPLLVDTMGNDNRHYDDNYDSGND